MQEPVQIVALLTIRSFQPEDQAAVIQLWRDCGLVRSNNDPAKDIARKQAVRPELFLIGLLDGAVVASAMVGYEGHRAWINYLAVSPQHQKRGLGRALMQNIERRLRAEGCPKINLQVRTDNAQVLAFYRALGYVPDDVVSLGKRLEHDNLIMTVAHSSEDFAQGRALIEEYQRWLGIDLCFQNFSSELKQLPTMYGHPTGALILAKLGERLAGCVGVRPLEPEVAEMKRLYVPEAFRGSGIGRALAERSIVAARELGYQKMRLDTVPRLKAAQSIYQGLGFVPIPPDRAKPDPETLSFELAL